MPCALITAYCPFPQNRYTFLYRHRPSHPAVHQRLDFQTLLRRRAPQGQHHRALLKSFLDLPDEEFDLSFMDTALKPASEEGKTGIVDVKIKARACSH
jgi:hypothetical protein